MFSLRAGSVTVMFSYEVILIKVNYKHHSTQSVVCVGVYVQGAANKSNPLPCFVNISTTNMNFYKKIYTAIFHLYLRLIAELY